MEVIDTSSSTCSNRCRSGHMTGLHSIWSNIRFPTLTAVMFSVSGPLKTFPSRRSIWLVCQTLETNSRQSQLLPTSSVAILHIQKTSRGIQSRSLNHNGRVPASLSHHEASDEFITSGLTNGFERRASAPLGPRWQQQKPVSPPQSCLRCGAALPRLDSSAWWKSWAEWTLCYELINAS